MLRQIKTKNIHPTNPEGHSPGEYISYSVHQQCIWISQVPECASVLVIFVSSDDQKYNSESIMVPHLRKSTRLFCSFERMNELELKVNCCSIVIEQMGTSIHLCQFGSNNWNTKTILHRLTKLIRNHTWVILFILDMFQIFSQSRPCFLWRSSRRAVLPSLYGSFSSHFCAVTICLAAFHHFLVLIDSAAAHHSAGGRP